MDYVWGAVTLVGAVLLAVAASGIRVVAPGEALVITRSGRTVRSHGPGPAYQVPLLEQGRNVSTDPVQRWLSLEATTTDGGRAHLQVDYCVQVTEPLQVPPNWEVITESSLTEALRRMVTSSTAAGLPDRGDVPDWHLAELPAGVELRAATVGQVDLEVTGELRRMLRSGASWT